MNFLITAEKLRKWQLFVEIDDKFELGGEDNKQLIDSFTWKSFKTTKTSLY